MAARSTDLTDEQFIAQWFKSECSAAKMSHDTGYGVRSIYRRRAKLHKDGHNLPTNENTGGRVLGGLSPYQQRWSFPRQIDVDVPDGQVIIFSDAHFWPGGRTVANEALLLLIKRLQPKMIIANGDIFDGARVSRHDPHGWGQPPSVKEELDTCQTRMHEIELAAPRGCLLEWPMGNHDVRFDRVLASTVPGYEGTIPRLSDYFTAWRQSWSVMINGNVMVKHRQAGGVHAVYNNTLKGGLTMVTGHVHRLIVTPWGDYRGRRWGVDSGTLADPHGPQFEYLENAATPWCSGFAVLTFRDGELAPPELVEVISDRAWFRGEVIYSAPKPEPKRARKRSKSLTPEPVSP